MERTLKGQMSMIHHIGQFIIDHSTGWIGIRMQLKDVILKEDYIKAEEILERNKKYMSKYRYKEWKQQIIIARDGGVYWKKKNKAVVIHVIISILYALAFFVLLLLLVELVQDSKILKYLILFGSPLWYYLASAWINRYYRMKYGFRIFERDFYNLSWEFTTAYVVAAILAVLNL